MYHHQQLTETQQQQLRNHYEIEKGLATRLRQAPKAERQHLYTEVYDELFLQLPEHPQIRKRADSTWSKREVQRQLRYLKPYCRGVHAYLEIGPGDCHLTRAMAGFVEQCYAVDVSEEIVSHTQLPANVQLVLSDGTSIPVPVQSIDFVYSHQLMEHLHPDDALEQATNVYRCLKPGGRYLCITPSHLTGPHDVSQHFDDVATGLHLKEYAYRDLITLFRTVGFTRFQALVIFKGHVLLRCPASWMVGLERLFAAFPTRLQRCLGATRTAHNVFGVNLLATK